MPIIQTATTSFKLQLMQGIHNFGPTSPDTFKVALYTSAATLGFDTTVYTTSNEVSSAGTGYTAGGKTLTINPSPNTGLNSTAVPTAFVSFDDVSWTNATFTTAGALIYNSTEGNKAVAVLVFNIVKTVNNDTFQIIFPTPDANNAIVRIS
jgi:hypothetical protein